MPSAACDRKYICCKKLIYVNGHRSILPLVPAFAGRAECPRKKAKQAIGERKLQDR